MFLSERIAAVLAGEEKQTSVTHRPHEWQSNVIFFEKHQVTIKKHNLSETRGGQAYVKGTQKYIISLTPLLRVRQFCGMKGEAHCSVTELTYMANMLNNVIQECELGKDARLGIEQALQHYGHDKRLNYAINPWGRDIDCEEPLKRLWRNKDVGAIFEGLGIKPTKSLKRMLLAEIDDRQYLPALDSIQFLWKMCPDVNLLTEVWPKFSKNQPNVWRLGKEERAALRSLISKWPKRTRMSFVRSIGKLSRSEYHFWKDVVSMVTGIHKELGQVLVRGRNIKHLHDNLFGETAKVEETKADRSIKYKDEEWLFNDHEFAGGRYALKLPRTTHELVGWGKKLNNCLAGYTNKIYDRQSTIIAVQDRLYGNLVAGIEVAYGGLIQMSGHSNQHLDSPFKAEILIALRDVGAINNIHAKLSDIHRNTWYRMSINERRMREAQFWLPGVAPMIETPAFPGENVINPDFDAIPAVAVPAPNAQAGVALQPYADNGDMLVAEPPTPTTLDNTVPF